jgi:hypothetical protein
MLCRSLSDFTSESAAANVLLFFCRYPNTFTKQHMIKAIVVQLQFSASFRAASFPLALYKA